MAGPILILITALFIGAAWIRVAYVHSDGPRDVERSYRMLTTRLSHAIVITLFFTALWLLGLFLQMADAI